MFVAVSDAVGASLELLNMPGCAYRSYMAVKVDLCLCVHATMCCCLCLCVCKSVCVCVIMSAWNSVILSQGEYVHLMFEIVSLLLCLYVIAYIQHLC